ncbi:hypothetical protein [Spirochaeta isovalerica]|uniref:DNA-binding LacI/PurR family transcriptional regulator n=1 Tax=Spirochaeta isovalerica TaxID=150 RepID=A0A841RA72_9SPIO|nr:hypothetical protein [Spirochaeta isovalerica]MBB6479910.1 DNA-binding LacI/PurR family transcriptional regulator [Spirochaeta isovalerica]
MEARLDGLIFISTSLSPFIEYSEFTEFTRLFPSSIPKVSLGDPVPGMSSVRISPQKGIAQAVDHLVTDHGRRNFAVVEGLLRKSCYRFRSGAT